MLKFGRAGRGQGGGGTHLTVWTTFATVLRLAGGVLSTVFCVLTAIVHLHAGEMAYVFNVGKVHLHRMHRALLGFWKRSNSCSCRKGHSKAKKRDKQGPEQKMHGK